MTCVTFTHQKRLACLHRFVRWASSFEKTNWKREKIDLFQPTSQRIHKGKSIVNWYFLLSRNKIEGGGGAHFWEKNDNWIIVIRTVRMRMWQWQECQKRWQQDWGCLWKDHLNCALTVRAVWRPQDIGDEAFWNGHIGSNNDCARIREMCSSNRWQIPFTHCADATRKCHQDSRSRKTLDVNLRQLPVQCHSNWKKMIKLLQIIAICCNYIILKCLCNSSSISI